MEAEQIPGTFENCISILNNAKQSYESPIRYAHSLLGSLEVFYDDPDSEHQEKRSLALKVMDHMLQPYKNTPISKEAKKVIFNDLKWPEIRKAIIDARCAGQTPEHRQRVEEKFDIMYSFVNYENNGEL